MSPRMRPRIAVLLTLVVALPAGGCGGDRPAADPPATLASGTYAGAVTGTDAYVAVLVDAGRAAGYLCDRGAVSAWFAARPHRGGSARLSSRTGAARLAVRPAHDGTVAVRVTLPDGRRRAVTLDRVRGEAGLYHASARTDRGGVEAGWIVLPDGTRRGAANQFSGQDIELGRPEQTTAARPLNTGTGTVKWAVPGAENLPARKLTQPGFIGNDINP